MRPRKANISRKPITALAVHEPLERRVLLSHDHTIPTELLWTGLGDGIDWHDPLNWSANRLPGTNDDVVIDVPQRPTIQVTDVVAVRSIRSSESLDVNAYVHVQHASQFDAPVTLNGTIAGPGDAVFTSTINWHGGSFAAGGKLIVAPGAEMNIDIPGGPADVLTHELDRSVQNFGAVRVLAGYTATLALSDCAFENQPGSTLQIGGGSITLTGDNCILDNSGTLSISPGSFVEVRPVLFNRGTIDIAGELHLHGNTTDGGELAVDGTASFFARYTQLSDGSISGAGAVNFYASASVGGAVDGLNLLAIATTQDAGVEFLGPVNANTLVCVNESAEPELLIGSFYGSTVVGDMEIVAGRAQFNGPLSASNLRVGAYGELRGALELGATAPDLGNLFISDSSVQLWSGERPYRSLRVRSLVGEGAWNVDIGNGSMIVDYTGASPLSQIRDALGGGYAEGRWNGRGINSTDATFSDDHAIGFAEATDLFGKTAAVFGGFEIDDSAILLRYTRYGDANLDNQVDLLDFNRLAANFGGTKTTWSQGNFNYDDATDLEDLNLLLKNFTQPTQAAITLRTGAALVSAADEINELC